MNILIKTIAVSSVAFAYATFASVSVSKIDLPKKLTATVNTSCKVASSSQHMAQLDLSKNAGLQKATTLSIWCNNDGAATTTFSSSNGGFLESNSGEQIAYQMSLGEKSNIDMQNQYSTQSSRANTDGVLRETVVSILPKVNGLERAGNYTDTITVTIIPK